MSSILLKSTWDAHRWGRQSSRGDLHELGLDAQAPLGHTFGARINFILIRALRVRT